LGLPVGMEMHETSVGEVFCSKGQWKQIEKIIKQARTNMRVFGVIDLRLLKDEFEQTIAAAPAMIDFSISCMHGHKYLDAKRNWVTVDCDPIRECPKISDEKHASGGMKFPGKQIRTARGTSFQGLTLRIARIAAFTGGMSVTAMLNALSRARVAMAHQIPQEVLISLCIHAGLTVRPMDSEWIIKVDQALANELLAEIEGTVELRLARLLQLNSGIMSKRKFTKASVQAGINKNSHAACLKTASLFYQHGPMVSLAGHPNQNETATLQTPIDKAAQSTQLHHA
jgi:hypothetical protein